MANTGSITWRIIGAAQTAEGGVPTYTVSYTGTPIVDPVTIQLDPIFPGGVGAANPEGGGGANPADYDGTFAAAVQAAIAALPPGANVTFNAATFELTFAPGGATSFTFSLATTNDSTPEGTENFLVHIQNQSFGVVETGFDGALTSILDNDAFAPTQRLWSITGDYAAVEGGAPRFTVTLAGEALANGQVVSVTLLPQFQSGLNLASAADFVQSFAADVQAAIAALPPGHGISYNSGTGQLSFTGGGLTGFQFSLPTLADAAFEGDEIYLVNLTGASAGTAVAGNAESVFSIIVDRDAVPAGVEWLIAGTQLVAEGGDPTYTVKWKGPALDAGETVSIQLGIELPNNSTGAYLSDFDNVFTQDVLAAIAALPPGTAISYDDATRTLTFGPGAPQEFTFSLPTLDDLVREDIEAFAVTLLNPSEGHVIETLGGIVTRITDNEPPPSVTIGDAQATEGQKLVLDVSLSTASTTPITLALLAGSGTAAAGVDFETVGFEVSLDGGATWSPAGGPDGRHVTFPAFIKDIQVRIDTTGDTIDESTETMTLGVSSVVDGSVGSTSDTGTGTILDNDPPPSVSIGDAQVTEGQALVFDINLPNASSAPITLALTAGTGTALGGVDFEIGGFEFSTDGGTTWVPAGGPDGRQVTFAPGQIAMKVRIETTGDAVFEGTETMSLAVSNVVAGTIGPSNVGTGTILDNETPPNVTISDAQATEGQPLVFDVTLSGAAQAAITLELLAASGSALAGTDFEVTGFEVSTDGGATWVAAAGATGREITFAPGATALKVRLDTTDDALFEGTETMSLSVSNVVAGPAGTTSDTGTGTILDSDTAPNVTIADAQATEGQPLVFDVALSVASATAITLELLAASGTATAGTDFETAGFQVSTDGGTTWVDAGGATGREVTFVPGTTALKVRIDTTDDIISETTETMSLSVSSVVAGTVGSTADTGTGTILENDAAPSVTIGNAEVTEGQALVFDVTLSNPSSQAIFLHLQAQNGTALGGVDFETVNFEVSTDGGLTWSPAAPAFTPPPPNVPPPPDPPQLPGGVVTFAPGATALKVRIDTTDDTLFEGAETMTLVASPYGANVPVGSTADTGTGTILDNDPMPSVTIGDAQATEGQPLAFDVTLSNASASTITLRLAANSGTAAAGTDFETTGFQVSTDGGTTWVDAGGPNGRDVTFAPGTTALKVRVDTTDDAISEGSETMSLAVEGVVAGNVLGSADTGAGTILDNDAAPTVTIGDAQATEGQPLVFDVTLSNASSQPINLHLQTQNGTAQGGTDFETVSFEVSTDGGLTWTTAGTPFPQSPPGVPPQPDPLPLPGGVVTFAPGVTALKVRVDTTDDTVFEGTETLTLTAAPYGFGVPVGSTADTGAGTILDNEAAPSVTIGDAQAAEGQPLVFDVTLSAQSAAPITLELAAGNGTAQGGVDFETQGFQVSTDGGATWVDAGGATGRQVTFAPGTTALKVRVDTTDDTADESNETMTLSVSSVVTGTVGNIADTGTGTIVDNDEAGVCRLLINEIGLGVATTPSGETCASYIEIINAGTGTCTAAELACHRLKIEGPCGNDSVVKFASFHPAVSLPPGAFLVVYENGEFKTVDAGGTLLAKGTWDCDGGWDLGSTVADELAVNLFLKSGESVDAFFANGFDPRGFRGADFTELDAPKGAAKIAHKAGVDGDVLDHDGFNGVLGDPRALMDQLGLDKSIEKWALKGAEPLKVFARVFGPGDGIDPDTNSAADWTVSNAATVGKLNVAPDDLNPRDPADDLDPAQGTGANGAAAGQTVLDAATAGVVLVGKDGPDFLYGDSRDNDIRAGAHNDFAVGGEGNDRIQGDAGADLLVDLAGNDKIAGGSGDDIILATQANGVGPKNTGGDVLIGDAIAATGDPAPDDGRDVIIGGELVDIVFGDTLVLDSANAGMAFDLPPDQLAALLTGTLATPGGPQFDAALHEAQHANGKADWIETNGGNDVVFGQGGDDVIKAGNGNDVVYGGAGNDAIQGEAGNDTLVAGAGKDVLKGGAGDDVLDANPLEDIVEGGAGKDTLALTMGGVLDLAGHKARGIEQLDLRGGQDLDVKLSFKDILKMTDNGKLTVLGQAGDHLTLDLSGHKVATHTSGGFTVHVIDNGAAVLKLSADLQHNVVGI